MRNIGLVDLFYLLLSKWWIILTAILVSGLFFWVKYEREEPRYFRTATVIIKDASTRLTTGGLDRFDHSINKINLTNEIRQFKSMSVLRDVVTSGRLDLHYRRVGRLRDQELYTGSPIVFKEMGNGVQSEPSAPFSLTVTVVDSVNGVISDLRGMGVTHDEKLRFRFGHPFKVSEGETPPINILLTDQFSLDWLGKKIRIVRVPVEGEVGRLQNSISVFQDYEESSILTIRMTGLHPAECEDVISSLIEVYNLRALVEKNHVVENTSRFIQERIKIIEAELGEVETRLENYRHDNGIMTVDASGASHIEDNKKALQEIDQYETQLSWIESVREWIEGAFSRDTLLPEHTQLDIDGPVARYNELLLRRKRYASHGGETNPVNRRLDEQLDELRHSIRATLDNGRSSIRMKMAEADRRQIEAEVGLATLPTVERELLAIQRQQKIKESLYLFLLNKREENALSRAMADDNARMIDPPHGPSQPISPRRNRLLILGGLIGLLLSVGGIMAKKYLDMTIHSRKDVEERITVPFIGEIPFDKNVRKMAEVIKSNPRCVTAEAMRLIRTNISFMSQNGPNTLQVITMTSFIPGVGKSFLIQNIASSLASAGHRVAVVDLDIRKGTLSHRIGIGRLASEKGVTTYLTSPSTGEDEVIVPCGDYDFIPSGPIPLNPAELLMSQRLDRLFAGLRKRYDYILADNVPLGMIADSSITNRLADLTIFVLRAGKSDIRQLDDIQHLYDEGTLKNMCVLLNGVVFSRHYGYYGTYSYV